MKMNNRLFPSLGILALLLFQTLESAAAVPGSGAEEKPGLDNLVGQPVDLARWAYAWRADRAVQEQPEAYFIPRRLERMDQVYRTALPTLGPDQMKSTAYTQPDLLTPLPPPPKGKLLAGLLWTGRMAKYQVALHWPAEIKELPSPKNIEVRTYPTAWGWFGWTVDQVLGAPEISADGRTWTYRPRPGATMDLAYNARVEAATEMIAVFAEGAQPAVPLVGLTGANLGTWKRMDIEIEWGLPDAPHAVAFDGRLDAHVAILGATSALPGGRRGVAVSLLYAPDSRPGLDSRVSVLSKTAGVTIRLSDLERGPIFVPQQGLFVTKAGSGKTARQFAGELATQNLKSVRQMVRAHREAASWDEALQEVRLWRCTEGTAAPPFPPTAEPAMQVELPDPRWGGMWRTATEQLRGGHMWGNLAFEVANVARAMELVGLHAEAAKVYDYFLASPGVKADGDNADPRGSLEWAKSMRHDLGYSHEGTHCSTGRLLYSMMERYFLTGDKAWFARHRARLQAAADWIIRERRGYLQQVPNRKELHVAGLMPPCMVGDYALPACDWHWYYFDNVFALQGLRRFADVLLEVEPAMGRRYRKEAEAFRADLRRAVEREAALTPVRLARNGTYRSYIPTMAYARGLMYTELGAPNYGGGRPVDLMVGGLPLAAVLPPDDYRIMDTLDVMEEAGTSVGDTQNLAEARKKKGLPTEDAWFWLAYAELVKASFNAEVYLLQDDVPNFLRFWINASLSMVGANGKLWEHWHPDSYGTCDNPDNGTAGWFLINFRNLLVMEEGDALWLARATPRAWLEQGRNISVKNAPTHFGAVAYAIVSDVDHGKITATVEMPSRKTPKSVLLRLRHPKAVPIKSVEVNGKSWKGFDGNKEAILLEGLTGKVTVQANY